MSSFPMAMVRLPRQEEAVLILMVDKDGDLAGLEPFTGTLYEVKPADIVHLVSDQPAAVYPFIMAEYAAQERLLRANPSKMRLRAVGHRFSALPKDFISGYPIAERTIKKHRQEVPEEKTIILSVTFALSTVRAGIREAERSYDCFSQLYVKQDTMPPLEDVVNCFAGLQNSKAANFNNAAPYAPVIRSAIASGLKDRALRAHLALNTRLPKGLSLAKLSFTLALLGHDCVCFDARLLGIIFPDKVKRESFDRRTGKNAKGIITDAALDLYERGEDMFVEGNDYYDSSDPLGRARCQWQSWEASGKPGQKTASHSVWLNVVGGLDNDDSKAASCS